MITLTPTVEEFPNLVRVLLDLADSVYDVNTTTDTPSLGLVIPEYLYKRYQFYIEVEQHKQDPSPLPARKKRSPK
jgi:hypothetical protein